MSIQKKSRKNKPSVSEAQEITQNSRLRSLVKNTFCATNDIVCIMDDKSYFTLDGNEWQVQNFYEGRQPIRDKVKCVEHRKFPKKVLVSWMSDPVFYESGLAVNSERYIKYCLPKEMDFIARSNQKLNVIFWLD